MLHELIHYANVLMLIYGLTQYVDFKFYVYKYINMQICIYIHKANIDYFGLKDKVMISFPP